MEIGPEVLISGVTSLFIYEYDGKKFFLFGDEHYTPVQGSCEKKFNIKCDTLDYGFEESVTYNSNYWTIVSLLDEWFTYNNLSDIVTDFYVEVPFTK